MMTKVPLLFLGDAPSAMTGLGRILRDLAIRTYQHCGDIFEVGTLGYGGVGDRNLPFPQYVIESMKEWFIPCLPEVWQNFAGTQRGVIFTIWDASRLLWFSRPENKEWCPDRNMSQWLQRPPFVRWGYFPQDATGPNGLLSCMLQESMIGFNRVLCYSKWAENMTRRSMSEEESARVDLQNLPHGIDTSVFHPRDRREARGIFKRDLNFNGPGLRPEEKVIGIIATNQNRKDFGLAMETISRMKDIPLRLYIQTDTLERYWSIPALLMDYGLMNRTIVNCNPVSDTLMSYIYSACDATLGIGAGEGFGYPIFESLSCGTPVLTGNYGGHAEWIDDSMMSTHPTFRIEGLYNCVRPVFNPMDWTVQLRNILDKARTNESLLPQELEWTHLWPKWEHWFRTAYQSLRVPAPIPVATSNSI